jgi:hypothetical protein
VANKAAFKAAKKAAKSAAKKSVTKSAKKSATKTAKKPAKKTPRAASPSTLSFRPAKTELATLRAKLQAILDAEGPNLTIQGIIEKIDGLDAALICQTIMTPTFP